MTSQREGQLRRLAESYTAAWCSQNAARVAGFYSRDGSLRVNGDPTYGTDFLRSAVHLGPIYGEIRIMCR
jgi:hypothetical protein